MTDEKPDPYLALWGVDRRKQQRRKEDAQPARTSLRPMPDEEGAVSEWYFDADSIYIDVKKDAQGKLSIYVRDRADNREGWLDQADDDVDAQQAQPADPQPSREAFENWLIGQFGDCARQYEEPMWIAWQAAIDAQQAQPAVCPDELAAEIRDMIAQHEGPSLFNLAEEIYAKVRSVYAQPAQPAATGINSPFNACMYRDQCRALLAQQAQPAASVRKALEAVATLCDEMEMHYSAYKDTALLNGDVELSNAASGESRACRFIAERVRAMNPQDY